MEVRLPLACGADSTPTFLRFIIFKMTDATDYQILRQDSLWTAGPDQELDVIARSGADLHAVAWTDTGFPLTASPTAHFYERADRVYVGVSCPIHTNQWYLMVTLAYYGADKRWDFFLNPADVGTDNNSASTVAYEYHPAADRNITDVQPVPADLGYSFVFQGGLGMDAISYERYFSAGDYLRFAYLLPCPAGQWWYSGALNFITEFRLNLSQMLTWGLQITSRICVGGVNYSYDVINRGYWNVMVNDQMILASDPVMWNYTTNRIIGGTYYLEFTVDLYIQVAKRATFLMFDNEDAALYAGNHPFQKVTRYSTTGDVKETLFFDLWSTLSLDNVSYNMTGTHSPPKAFSTHQSHPIRVDWMDGLAILFIIGGIIAAPFTLGGSLVLISIGVGMILYQNWPALRGAVDGILKGLLDGLEWLGNWIWKLGEYIWKALTWFVDQAIYYGSILIGLLIIGVAIALFIGPIYAIIKIWGAFLLMAQGEYEKAAAQLSGVIQQGKSAVSTVTGGRLG
jgi:hypothetical protein